MSGSDSFAACEETVRRHDADRYYATLFAPQDKRPHLFALYAFYRELAHAVEAAREPMVLDIRLAWWRETIGDARAGRPREHHVARALAAALAAHDLPQAVFARMIEARASEAGGMAFAGAAEAEEHADATSGALMRMACRVLGEDADEAARAAGIAYALAGRTQGLYRNVDTARIARWHLDAVRKLEISRTILPGMLPAALVPLYLRRRNPPVWRRQLSLFLAARRGRI